MPAAWEESVLFRLFVDEFRAHGCLQAFGSTAFDFRKILSGKMFSHNMTYADQWRWGENHKVWIHLASTYGITMVLNRSAVAYGGSLVIV